MQLQTNGANRTTPLPSEDSLADFANLAMQESRRHRPEGAVELEESFLASLELHVEDRRETVRQAAIALCARLHEVCVPEHRKRLDVVLEGQKNLAPREVCERLNRHASAARIDRDPSAEDLSRLAVACWKLLEQVEEPGRQEVEQVVQGIGILDAESFAKADMVRSKQTARRLLRKSRLLRPEWKAADSSSAFAQEIHKRLETLAPMTRGGTWRWILVAVASVLLVALVSLVLLARGRAPAATVPENERVPPEAVVHSNPVIVPLVVAPGYNTQEIGAWAQSMFGKANAGELGALWRGASFLSFGSTEAAHYFSPRAISHAEPVLFELRNLGLLGDANYVMILEVIGQRGAATAFAVRLIQLDLPAINGNSVQSEKPLGRVWSGIWHFDLLSKGERNKPETISPSVLNGDPERWGCVAEILIAQTDASAEAYCIAAALYLSGASINCKDWARARDILRKAYETEDDPKLVRLLIATSELSERQQLARRHPKALSNADLDLFTSQDQNPNSSTRLARLQAWVDEILRDWRLDPGRF
jgi:hypothetical protein